MTDEIKLKMLKKSHVDFGIEKIITFWKRLLLYIKCTYKEIFG